MHRIGSDTNSVVFTPPNTKEWLPGKTTIWNEDVSPIPKKWWFSIAMFVLRELMILEWERFLQKENSGFGNYPFFSWNKNLVLKTSSWAIFVRQNFQCLVAHVMDIWVFPEWWYPQNTPKWSFLVGKPMVVGYHHLRKPLYIGLQALKKKHLNHPLFAQIQPSPNLGTPNVVPGVTCDLGPVAKGDSGISLDMSRLGGFNPPAPTCPVDVHAKCG